eukprot:1345264-Amphidinium_carterae.1
MIVVGSQEYLIANELGVGGFGCVHAARLVEYQPKDVVFSSVDMDSPPEQRPDQSHLVAVKLSGSIGEDGYLNVDLKLAAMAVEAAVAAEVRRATRDEGMKWEGKVFLPVLHSVGKVVSVGGITVRSMAAIVMEMADGTLMQKQHPPGEELSRVAWALSGEALSRVAWALASTLSALNRA